MAMFAGREAAKAIGIAVPITIILGGIAIAGLVYNAKRKAKVGDVVAAVRPKVKKKNKKKEAANVNVQVLKNHGQDIGLEKTAPKKKPDTRLGNVGSKKKRELPDKPVML